jgi:formate--tetrahydrofolate ligase
VLSDIEIVNAAVMDRITDVGRDRLGIPEDQLVPYGHHKAKVDLRYLATLEDRPARARPPRPSG